MSKDYYTLTLKKEDIDIIRKAVNVAYSATRCLSEKQHYEAFTNLLNELITKQDKKFGQGN